MVCGTLCVETAIAISTSREQCLVRSLDVTTLHTLHRHAAMGAWIDLQRLSSKAEPRAIASIENNELRFEEDVTEDGETDASVRLNATEAS